MAATMSMRAYKTNWLLWFFASLLCLLLFSYDIQFVVGLFSGESKVEDLLSFEFIAPLIISVVLGWLAQCAIIIVVSWRREKTKH
jgi:hypothetical protein